MEDLLTKFKGDIKGSQLSDQLLELSDKLGQIRLSELRANREANELREKQTYLSKLLRTKTDEVRACEETRSELEAKLHRREEEYRKLDNDRQRRFFNQRFQGRENRGGHHDADEDRDVLDEADELVEEARLVKQGTRAHFTRRRTTKAAGLADTSADHRSGPKDDQTRQL